MVAKSTNEETITLANSVTEALIIMNHPLRMIEGTILIEGVNCGYYYNGARDTGPLLQLRDSECTRMDRKQSIGQPQTENGMLNAE